MTGTVFQDELFAASPEEVFDVLAESGRHSEMTGAPAAMAPTPGSRFSAYGGALEGEVLEAERPHRLVLKWRGKDWQREQFSNVTFQIEGDSRQSILHLTHENLPEEHYEVCSRGWGQSYWSKMRSYFLDRRKAVVERFVEEYKNRHNWDIVDELIAEDCAVHIPLPGLPQGREGMRINGRMVCTAFPDVHVTREFFVAQGDIVVERARAAATHKADLMGVPATGNPVTWTELHAYRVHGGLITEVWSEADFMGIMVQIGAVQMPG